VVTVGTFVVTALHNDRAANFERTPGGPDFNPFLYTVSTFVPVVNFGYSKWVAHGGAQIVYCLLVASGWLLVTAAVAALTGILRRAD
jgi:hypothetical protein